MSGEITPLIQRVASLAVCAAILSSACTGSGAGDMPAETNDATAESTLAIVTDATQSAAADRVQDGAECKQIADALTPYTQENIERAAAQYSDNGDSEGLAERLSKCDDANGLGNEAAAYVLPQSTGQVQIRYQYGPESFQGVGPTGASAFIEGSNILLASVEFIGMGGGSRREPLTIRFAETQFSDSDLKVYKGVLKFHWATGERFASDRLLGHQLADIFKQWPR